MVLVSVRCHRDDAVKARTHGLAGTICPEIAFPSLFLLPSSPSSSPGKSKGLAKVQLVHVATDSLVSGTEYWVTVLDKV